MAHPDQGIAEKFVALGFCPRMTRDLKGTVQPCKGEVLFDLESEDEEQVVYQGQCAWCGTRFLLSMEK